MIVFVTPAEQELARLDLELSDQLGEAPDARMKAIVNAEPLPYEPRQPGVFPAEGITRLNLGGGVDVYLHDIAEDLASKIQQVRLTMVRLVEEQASVTRAHVEEAVDQILGPELLSQPVSRKGRLPERPPDGD